MKYKIICIEKSGMMNHWDELELPDDAIPLHTEIWKTTRSERDVVHDIGKIFSEDGYKYNKETGEVIQSRKDGRGLEEFKIITKIYCLVRIPEEYRDNNETSSKIEKTTDSTEFIQEATNLRSEIKNIENDTFDLKTLINVNEIELLEVSDKGEILANITIAFRKLEDARMRIGKAIQAYDGGTSVYGR